jgi:hypothetical protein
MKKSILQQNKHRAVNQKDLGIRRGLFLYSTVLQSWKNIRFEADRLFTSERIEVVLIDIVWFDCRR